MARRNERRSRALRALRTSAGLVLIATGAPLLVLPGPGLLIIGAGIALIPGGRRKLERLARYWNQRHRPA